MRERPSYEEEFFLLTERDRESSERKRVGEKMRKTRHGESVRSD